MGHGTKKHGSKTPTMGSDFGVKWPCKNPAWVPWIAPSAWGGQTILRGTLHLVVDCRCFYLRSELDVSSANQYQVIEMTSARQSSWFFVADTEACSFCPSMESATQVDNNLHRSQGQNDSIPKKLGLNGSTQIPGIIGWFAKLLLRFVQILDRGAVFQNSPGFMLED